MITIEVLRELIRELKADLEAIGVSDEISRLRKENEKLRINEGPLLMAALTEVNEIWLPLLKAAKAVQLDDDMESDVALMKAIEACEEG